jgi:transcriptional regulator with XRE-family HTH domain
MIRLTDPTRIGPALGQVRQLLGISRRSLARQLAAKTGRSETSVNSQLWGWENGIHAPDLASVPLLLDALGVYLALVPDDADPPSASHREPHTAVEPSVVGRVGVATSEAAETISGGDA